MNLRYLFFLPATLVIWLAAIPSAPADVKTVGYVSDILTITVRTGKGSEFAIIRTITSGTPVEILRSESDGYSRVRLQNSAVGYVLSRYLQDAPVARERLARAEAKLKEAEDRLADSEAATSRLESEIQQKDQQLAHLTEQLATVGLELDEARALAEEPMKIGRKNKKLEATLKENNEEIQLLRQMNAKLKDSDNRDWFLIGAGVLLGGLILGLVLPSLKFRRRSSWDRF